METVTDFIFGGSKITADGDDGSHEIKRCLLLGRKAMTNLDSILKSRDTTLATNVHPVKARVLPVLMYGFGRNDAKAETPVLWLPDAKNYSLFFPRCWKRSKAEEEGEDRG